MFTLFGPVLAFDLVRTARKGRFIWLRVAYALFLVFLLFMSYESAVAQDGPTVQGLSRFAETFLYTFLFTQYLVALLLTPTLVGEVVAEEKVKRTMDYLLTSQLTMRELLLGKLTARLATVALFVLTGLPVLSLAGLFGGINPTTLWAGFAATGLTILSVGGLSLVLSAYARQPRDAIVQGVLLVLCYYIGWPLLWFLCDAAATLATWAQAAPGEVKAAGEALQAVYNAGNLFAAYGELEGSGGTALPYETAVIHRLAWFALWHGAVVLVTVTRAVAVARPVFVAQAFGAEGKRRKHPTAPAPLPETERGETEGAKPQAAAVLGASSPLSASGRGAGAVGFWRRRPPVGDAPMTWKEVFVEAGFRFGCLGKALVAFLLFAGLAPLAIGAVWHLANEPDLLFNLLTGGPTPGSLAREMNEYLRVFVALGGSILLLAVGVRAAGTLPGERDRQTFDGLLASPLGVHEILGAKWLGAVAWLRWWVPLVGCVFALALLTGGLHWTALPVVVTVFAALAAFAAALGLFWAAWFRTNLLAVAATVAAMLALTIGPYVSAAMVAIVLIGPSSLREHVEAIRITGSVIYGGLLGLLLGLLLFGLRPGGRNRRLMALVVGLGAAAATAVLLYLLLTAASEQASMVDLDLVAFLVPAIPPGLLGVSPYQGTDVTSREFWPFIITGTFGVMIYALAAGVLYLAAVKCLPRHGGRVEGTIRPRRPRPLEGKGAEAGVSAPPA